ncbi:MAG TPA: twin-arginine translocase TatA/TatE family subunit [Acidimicrobiales bacterium]|nr:twin-arginine translocase TatA/TatE family subunit [Acidimicrobiales bacterium]
MNLDPAKLLVILVIGLLVLGPERLPRVARQLGHLWQEFTTARDRLVEQIKEQVPDLPNPRSFRSILVDPRSPAEAAVIERTPHESSELTPVDEESPGIAWSAHQRGSRDAPLSIPRDIADPTMN